MRLRSLIVLVGMLLPLIGCRDERLARSVRTGNVVESNKLLSEGVNLNARDSKGQTALHAAIEAGDKDMFHRLLEKGANPNLCNDKGASVVHWAARQEDVFWLDEALKLGGNPNQPNTGNRMYPTQTPIFYAINAWQRENILRLMAAGADVNHVDGNNLTPLGECMEVGLYSVMIELLDAGANPTPPKPAHSIFVNGWFHERYETTIKTEEQRQAYRAMKERLIELGYLKNTKGGEKVSGTNGT